MPKLNVVTLEELLSEINNTYPTQTPEKYMEQAELGVMLADYLLSLSKTKGVLKIPKKQLKEASKRLKTNAKSTADDFAVLGAEIAPKHLWSVIQLIQQTQHLYVVSGARAETDIIWLPVMYLQGVPNTWEIAKQIDDIAQKRRELSGQFGK